MKGSSLATVGALLKKKPAEGGEEDMGEDESSESYDVALDEFLDAMESGDREAAKEAFKAAVMGCK